MNHSECSGIDGSQDLQPLQADRRCRYGGDAVLDAILGNRASTKKACNRITYIVSNVHAVYWKRTLDSLCLDDKLGPSQLARIILLGVSKPDLERTGQSKVHRDQIDHITELHPSLKAAIDEMKLLPRREGTPINTKSMTEMAKHVLSSCITTLEGLQ